MKEVERMRAKSKNLQGSISGKMRSNLTKAIEAINTLVLKAESKGDPAKLRIDNRALREEIEKMKLEEVLRQREMEELRAIVNTFKGEIEELKDKLDAAEEDRRKARESQRWAEWKAKNNSGLPSSGDVQENTIKYTDESKNTTSEEKITAGVTGEISTNTERLVNQSIDRSVEELGIKELSVQIDPTVSNKDKTEGNQELSEIQRKIKELAKRKNEIRLEMKRKGPFNSSETVSGIGTNENTPLPQRISKIRPKLLSNVQLVPPRSDKPNISGLYREAARETIRGKRDRTDGGTEDSSDNRLEWKTPGRLRKKNRKNNETPIRNQQRKVDSDRGEQFNKD